MTNFIRKYYKYLSLIFFIYLIINIIKNIFNIYIILIIVALLIYFYSNNKKLFKKVIYKILFKNKILNINDKYSAAKKSLKNISELKDLINDEVNSEIINYEKLKIEQQLKNADYSVILFGAGSCGKTSIARAILKSMVGNISPTLGTTKKISNYKIKIPFLTRKINIIDTPGLFEASIEGEVREKVTIKKAAKSDLIIFVIDQDLNKYELYLVKELSKIGKSLIIALNKCDLRSKNQNNIIKKNIEDLISNISKKYQIIETIASPQTIPNLGGNPIKQRMNVDNLFKAIINILESNGEDLLADNILFQCNKLGTLSKKIIKDQRQNIANKIINKYAWITSGVILITPIPAIDFLATSTINIKMIMEISEIYGIELSKEKAIELTKTILKVLAALGVVKGGINVISTILSTSFTTKVVAKSIQSVTAAWIIKIVGLSFIKYFSQNQDWGEGGIQDVVEKLYEINKREDILNNFVKEAIQRIKTNKNFESSKKLPPYSQRDYLNID